MKMVKRKYNNMQEYDKELSKITNDLFMPTDGSVETLEKVDKAYGTSFICHCFSGYG